MKILDLRLEKDLQGVLRDFCPDVVGITSYTVHVNTVRSLFEEIKGWNPPVVDLHAFPFPERKLTRSTENDTIQNG